MARCIHCGILVDDNIIYCIECARYYEGVDNGN
jgi:hypothetical protein